MYDIHCRAEGVNQSVISIAILFECLLSFLEQLEDRLGRIRLLECGSKRILGEVYASYLGVIGRSVGDQLDVGSGGYCCSVDDMNVTGRFFERRWGYNKA